MFGASSLALTHGLDILNLLMHVFSFAAYKEALATSQLLIDLSIEGRLKLNERTGEKKEGT